MSKKKPAGGSTTMTLKDFHGGSIPSDLPLPSAPGVTVRSSERAGFERQSAWGNPLGRSDQRLRPGSAGSMRNFDDKTPFLAHSVHIGRNFDEDERKPLDGVSAPRRTVCDENIISVSVRSDLKPDYSSNGRLLNCQVASSVSYLGGSSATSHGGNTKEACYAGLNSQNCVTNSYSGGFSDSVHAGGNYSRSGNSNINVWAMRKEVGNSIETMAPTSSAPNTALKLAHASAVEKVSSGRWQSKQAMNHPTDVEIIRPGETESEFHCKDEVIYNSNKSNLTMDVPCMMKYSDEVLASLADRGLSADDEIYSGEREIPVHDFSRFPKTFSVTSEMSTYADGLQHSHKSELQLPMPSELSDRPKLKLLPRSRPLHSLDLPIEHKPVYQRMHDSGHHVSFTGVRENFNTNKAESGGSYPGYQTHERPKLNLKPRSQPIEKFEANIERERNSVFGGARPRELVLKDYGLDDLTLNSQDPSVYNNRVKQDIQTVQTHGSLSLYNESAPIENNRMKINNDRRDTRGLDPERNDAQKRSWQNDNWRIKREIEKQPHQLQERPPSPETWRKPPAETQAKPPLSVEEVPGVHYGKAASAVELAQVFSKSVSNTNTNTRTDQFSGQRGGVLTQGKIPFSRLTTSSPSPRPQINGY